MSKVSRLQNPMRDLPLLMYTNVTYFHEFEMYIFVNPAAKGGGGEEFDQSSPSFLCRRYCNLVLTYKNFNDTLSHS